MEVVSDRLVMTDCHVFILIPEGTTPHPNCSPSSFFRRSSCPFSIRASASFTKAIIPPKGGDRISSMNSCKRDGSSWSSSKCQSLLLLLLLLRSQSHLGLISPNASVSAAYLRPGQKQLLETFHLFTVVCCPLLDKRGDSSFTYSAPHKGERVDRK